MRARAAAAIALSGAIALGLTGCNFVTYPATTKQYDPSDGVNFSVGTLQLRNLLVIAENDELGSLVGTAVNTGTADLPFIVTWEVDGEWHEVSLIANAGGRTDFSFGDGENVTLDPLGVNPGGLLEVVVQADGTQKGKDVPVLDTTLSEYEGLLPSPAPSETAITE